MNDKQRERKRERIIDRLRQGWSITTACSDAGIDRKTYYNWRDAEPEFAEAIDDALDHGVSNLEDIGYRLAAGGSVPMLQFLLKAKRPQVYREQTRHEIAGDSSAPVRIVYEIAGGAVDDEDGDEDA